MKLRPQIVAVAAGAALLLSGCGEDAASCTAPQSNPAQLAARGALPSSCTVAPGNRISIPVRLCPRCSDSRPGCQAEFLNDAVEIDPTFQECEEDRGCALNPGCELRDNTVNCSVTIPAGTPPGSYPIIYAASGQTGGDVEVGTSSSCSFALTED